MRKVFALVFLLLGTSTLSKAEEGAFSFDFYGFVRSEMSINSRNSVAAIEDNFYQYPMDVALDAEGNDLNAHYRSNLYALSTRVGVNIKGPEVWGAKTSAKIETDFAGFGGSAMLRLRQAHVNLDWHYSSLLVGQTFHPLFGDVSPSMLNLSTGSPFQPFNRSPMVRYRYSASNILLTGAAIYQYMSLSPGPNGKNSEYLRNSCLPELYASVDYKSGGLILGVGADMISLTPRTQSDFGGAIYKVNERITTLSAEAHIKYTQPKYMVAAKSLYGNNLAHTLLLGGYGVSSIDPNTGSREYTPFTSWSNWVNATYGTTYKVGVFAGYSKNLGTQEALANTTDVYGNGLNIDNLVTGQVSFSYNLPHWIFGIELSRHKAQYGDIDQATGQVVDLHDAVYNNRVQLLMSFIF